MQRRVKRVHIGVSTAYRRRQAVELGRIVGLARTQQVVDDPQERASEDSERLFLGTPTAEEALVADSPFGGTAGRDEGGEKAAR
jgi:hypothetical protein